jgi:hypothetical protein
MAVQAKKNGNCGYVFLDSVLIQLEKHYGGYGDAMRPAVPRCRPVYADSYVDMRNPYASLAGPLDACHPVHVGAWHCMCVCAPSSDLIGDLPVHVCGTLPTSFSSHRAGLAEYVWLGSESLMYDLYAYMITKYVGILLTVCGNLEIMLMLIIPWEIP